MKINDVLLETRRNGGGPVHINLTTSYSLDFSVQKLPKERMIRRFYRNSVLPIIPDGNIVIFVGAHSVWSEKLQNTVDSFCERYNAVVLYDQTSNYSGKYGVPCGMFNITGFPDFKVKLLIHIGNISATWPVNAQEIWRVNIDGEIRDTYQHLTCVFEMNEDCFFEAYHDKSSEQNVTQYEKWYKEYQVLKEELQSKDRDMKYSSLWIAQNMHCKMPVHSVIHFGILNSLRCWNCFELDQSIHGYSNTGGFGIDGGVSSLIGASLAFPEKIYYGIFGDLAFFYDMNSLGNRHISKNVRIMVVNNGLGGEFKNSLGNVQKAGLGDFANDYISAYGHYGKESRSLLKHYAQDLGFQYFAASNKEEFFKVMDEFVTSENRDKPMLFEVFMDDYEDVSAIDLLQNIGTTSFDKQNILSKTKKAAKNLIGRSTLTKIQKTIYRS